MADSYKDIIITPNRSNTADPKIDLRGGNSSVNTAITVTVYPDSNGTISFDGSAGQLFSITNDLSGLLWSVNDVSGIPSAEVYANGSVRLAEFSGNVSIGTATNSSKLFVNGNTTVNGSINVTSTMAAGNTTITGFANVSSTLNAAGAITQNGNQVLHAGNYTSYAPSLTGSGASGNWGINVTGSSASTTGNAGTVTNGVYTTGDQTIGGIKTFSTELGVPSFAGANRFISGTGDGASLSTYNFALSGWNGMAFYNPTVGGAFPTSTTGFVDFRNGFIDMRGSLRAPIFYDSNDTSYYVDANGTSVLSSVNTWGEIGPRRNDSGTLLRSYNTSASSALQFYLDHSGGNVNIGNNRGVVFGGGSYWEIANSVRSPIFYDSNDTAFYVNAASTSRLSAANVNFLTLLDDEGLNVKGIRGQFSAGSDNQGISLFSNVDIGYPSGWGAGLSNTPTRGLSVYGGLRVAYGGSGFVTSDTSVRSPVFYDSNDTGYYVDAASTSNLNGLTVASTITGSITGNADTVDGRHASYFYPNVTDNGYAAGDIAGSTAHQRLWGTDSVQDMFAFNQPTEVEYSTDGVTWVATTCPPGVFDGKVYGEWGGMSMNVGNSIGAWRFVRMTWRNFGYRFFSHFTLAHSTNGHSFNFVFYKSDLNGNFSSEAFRMNGINSWPGYTFVKHENVSGWWDTRDIRIVFELNHSGSASNPIDVGHIGLMGSYGGFNRVFDWNASREVTFLGASVRSPIFYDSNNTAFYVDPASTSILNTLTLTGSTHYIATDKLLLQHDGSHSYIRSMNAGSHLYLGGSNQNTVRLDTGNFLFSQGSVRSPIFYDSDNTGYYVDPSNASNLVGQVQINGGTAMTDGWNRSLHLAATFPVIVFNSNNTKYSAIGVDYTEAQSGMVFWVNGNSADITNGSATVALRISTGNFVVANDLRSPIFYDSNNTGYYIDAAGTSNLNGLTVASTITGSITGNAAGATFSNDSATQDNITTRTDSGFYQSSTGTTAEGWPLNDGGWQHMISCTHTNNDNYYAMQLGSGFYSQGLFYRVTNGSGSTAWSRVALYDNSYSSNLRANIFYDSDNTGYYIDPNSTSRMNAINADALRSYTNVYTDGNYGYGLVGLYSPYRYQGVFSMGGSWALPADGTTTGNLYGIAWSHPLAGGAAGNLNTHGALILENGSFLAALSGSIRCRDDMRAPIFYDSNDTGFFIDPNAGASMRVAGDITMGPELNMVEGSRGDRYIDVKGDLYFRHSDNVTFFNSKMLIRASGAILSYVDFESSGNITAYSSDRRLKTNITPIQNALQKVLSIGGYTFDWDIDKCAQHGFKPTNVHEHGVIAQEIEAIMPDVVVHAPFDKETRPNHDMTASKSGQWFKTVNYDKIVPLLIEAIKEQQEHINRLEVKINSLQQGN